MHCKSFPFKSSTVALVIAAAMASAYAQSNVSISGAVRLAVARSNGGTSPLYGSGNTARWTMNDNLSSLSFSGREDLGGGTYAGFSLQHFLQADSGADSNFSPNTWFDGQSIVSLGGRWGEITMGRNYTPTILIGFAIDPWGWDGSATQVGALELANYFSTSGIRTNNTVGYTTPTINGFTGKLAVSAGEQAKTGTDVGSSLVYAKGPVYVAGAWDQHKAAVGTTTDRLATVAAGYDFGLVKPMALFAKSRVNGVAYSSMVLSATAPVGAGVLKAAVARIDDWNTGNGTKDPLTKVSLGYQHNLSKRTHLFSGISNAKGSGATRTTVVDLGIGHTF
ncbi:MAG: porin [Pseudomonadota bacterium]